MFSVLNFGNGLFPLFWHLSKPIAKIQPQIEINEINPFHPQEAGQCLQEKVILIQLINLIRLPIWGV